jgi:hypothetical protein
MSIRPAVDAAPDARTAIDAVLDRFGTGALRVAASAGTQLVHLRVAERYRDRSPVLRRLASGVDDWPVPPAGLFVVEERTIYLRSTSPMTAPVIRTAKCKPSPSARKRSLPTPTPGPKGSDARSPAGRAGPAHRS